MSNLELIIMARSWSLVEMKRVGRQRLPGAVRERPPIQSKNRVRQPKAGGFQMALHAPFELRFHRQLRRVQNRFPNRSDVAAFRRFNMVAARAVASLAVNAFRDAPRETRFTADPVGSRCDFRIPAMTEYALVHDLAPEAGVVGVVVAWIHRPMAALFRVPGHGQ